MSRCNRLIRELTKIHWSVPSPIVREFGQGKPRYKTLALPSLYKPMPDKNLTSALNNIYEYLVWQIIEVIWQMADV